MRRKRQIHVGSLLALVLLAACPEPSGTRRSEQERAPRRTEPAQGAAQREPARTAPPADQPAPSPPVRIDGQALPSLAPLVESVKGTVVNVEVVSRRSHPRGQGGPGAGEDPFERFFGIPRRPPPGDVLQRGAGSGVIIDSKGLVVTNNHVVEGAQRIRVTVGPGRTWDAKILGRDPLTDLAVIRLEGKVENLPHSALGDSEALKVGDWVVAIGNPFGLASSVSAGIISGRGRDIDMGPYDDFLQTDAAINPGNSGGPLFDLQGRVVGINTAIVGGGTGIGFAIPSSIVKALLPQLERGEEIRRGFLGVGVQDLTPELAEGLKAPVRQGALIANVQEGSPAEKAGLKPEDVVVAVDGTPVESSRQLTRLVGFKQPGTDVKLTVYRGGEKRELTVKLGQRPDIEGVGSAGQEGAEQKSEQLGLSLDNVDPRYAQQLGIPSRGALIAAVRPGSIAEEAGLVAGMVVVEAGGKPVASARDLARIVAQAESGSVLLLRVVVREGRFLRALRIP